MYFKLSPQLLEKIPGLTATVIIIKNLPKWRKSSVVDQLLRGACAQKRNELQDKKKREDFFTKMEPFTIGEEKLAEALRLSNSVQTVLQGNFLEKKTNLASLLHLLAIKYLLPFGAADLDTVEYDVLIELTSRQLSENNDFFSSDTVHAALWFINPGFYSEEEFAVIVQNAVQALQQYCGGDLSTQMITSQNPQIDLEYQSDLEKARLIQEEEENRLAAEKTLREQEEQRQRQAAILKQQVEDQHDAAAPLTNKERVGEVLRITLEQWFASQSPEIQQQLEGLTPDDIALQTPQDSTHGDYATAIALKLAKKLGKNPMEVAESIAKIVPSVAMLEKVEVAQPGFINVHLSRTYLAEQMHGVLKQRADFGRLTLGKGKKVLIEYSSPNIAKPLGVHHLLSTIIGQTLTHLYRFAGYEVVALNWLGDWGTQFGKLLYAYKQWGKEETVKKAPLNELLQLYVRFHKEEEKNPELENKGREEFKKLEEGDEENTKLWTWMKELSVTELKRLYEILGVNFDEYLGEKMYLEKAKELIAEGKTKGIIEKGEEGAWIVRFENDAYPPYLLEKADGTTLYSTRDLASIQDRMNRYHPLQSIYVVDAAQKLHFEQLFATAQKFGFTGSALIHVTFGRMALPEGKMSTRKGEIILLEEVIAEAMRRTTKIVKEKSADLPALEQEALAKGLAISAILYNILSQNRETNITFDWDRMLALDGNSAPYLQYTCARANSILRKAEAASTSNEIAQPPQPEIESMEVQPGQISMFEEERVETNSSWTAVPETAETKQIADLFNQPLEQELLRLLPRFSEKIEAAVIEYKPNLLANYLYELAKTFNSFYQEVPVLTAETPEQKSARLDLVRATAQVLANGLGLLGIKVFERM